MKNNDKYDEIKALSKEEIATRIKAYRKENHISQESLARMLRIGRNTIERWENCHVKISGAMIRFLIAEKVL